MCDVVIVSAVRTLTGGFGGAFSGTSAIELGKPKIIDTDEFLRFGTATEGGLSKLKPAFKKEGSVTVGNTFGINDGASMLVIMSSEKAKELNVDPMARIVSYGSAGLDSQIMGYGSVPSSRKSLDKAELTINDIDLVEAKRLLRKLWP